MPTDRSQSLYRPINDTVFAAAGPPPASYHALSFAQDKSSAFRSNPSLVSPYTLFLP
jgi:hypothetical protein